MKIEEHLKNLKIIMRLQDWDIQLILRKAFETNAAVNCVYDDYLATITINSDMNEEEQIKSLIHELIHLQQRNVIDIARENISNDEVVTIWQRELERLTQKQAITIYNLYMEVNKY